MNGDVLPLAPDCKPFTPTDIRASSMQRFVCKSPGIWKAARMSTEIDMKREK
jgi:hypothetical protein